MAIIRIVDSKRKRIIQRFNGQKRLRHRAHRRRGGAHETFGMHDLQAAIIVKRCLQCVGGGLLGYTRVNSARQRATRNLDTRAERAVISMKVSVEDNDNATGLLHSRDRSPDALFAWPTDFYQHARYTANFL